MSKAPPGVAPTATAAATLNEAVGKASSPPPGTNDPGMNCAEDSETVVSVDGGPEIIAVDDNDEDVGIIVERVVRRGGETAAGAGDDGGKTGEPEEELTIIVGKDAEDEVKAIARERLSSWAMKFTAQRLVRRGPIVTDLGCCFPIVSSPVFGTCFGLFRFEAEFSGRGRFVVDCNSSIMGLRACDLNLVGILSKIHFSAI